MFKSKALGKVLFSTFILLSFICVSLFMGCTNGPQIAIYLHDNISEEQKENIEQKINSWEEVEEVTYISIEGAYERLSEKDKEDIETKFEFGPPPASFEVKLTSSDYIDVVVVRFVKEDGKYMEGIVDIIYGYGVMALFKD